MIKTTQFISHSLSHTVTIFYHSVMSCSWQTKVQKSVDFFLAAGSADRGQAEAKCLRPRPRPRPKFWPRGHFGLEVLTSLPRFVSTLNSRSQRAQHDAYAFYRAMLRRAGLCHSKSYVRRSVCPSGCLCPSGVSFHAG